MRRRTAGGAVKRIVAVACLFLACGCGGSGGGSTSATPTAPTTSTNHNPVINDMSVTPSFGVSGLTNFSATASASDPDGDIVSYQWTYAGTTAAGPSFAATLTGDGSIAVQLTVTDGKGGSSSDLRTVTLGNMTGTWTFIFTGACSPFVPPVLPIMSLTQAGNTVTGTLASPGNWCNVPAGQTGKLDPAAPMLIDGQGNVTNGRLKIGSYVDTFLSGQMDSTGRKITGVGHNPGFPDDTFEMDKR
ncbi:MAG: PKD domain-containing protein [Vicinamibacterales bacterium]